MRANALPVACRAPVGEHGSGDTPVAEREPCGQVEHHLVLAGVVPEDGDGLAAQSGQLVTADRPLRLSFGELRPHLPGGRALVGVGEGLDLDRGPLPQPFEVDDVLDGQAIRSRVDADRADQGDTTVS